VSLKKYTGVYVKESSCCLDVGHDADAPVRKTHAGGKFLWGSCPIHARTSGTGKVTGDLNSKRFLRILNHYDAQFGL
jgi:hypothetical protein